MELRCAREIYPHSGDFAFCFLFVPPAAPSDSLMVGPDTKKKIQGDVCSAATPSSVCAFVPHPKPVLIHLSPSHLYHAAAVDPIHCDPSHSRPSQTKHLCMPGGTRRHLMSSSKNTTHGLLESTYGSTTPIRSLMARS